MNVSLAFTHCHTCDVVIVFVQSRTFWTGHDSVFFAVPCIALRQVLHRSRQRHPRSQPESKPSGSSELLLSKTPVFLLRLSTSFVIFIHRHETCGVRTVFLTSKFGHVTQHRREVRDAVDNDLDIRRLAPVRLSKDSEKDSVGNGMGGRSSG